jgi:hypothetical protein
MVARGLFPSGAGENSMIPLIALPARSKTGGVPVLAESPGQPAEPESIASKSIQFILRQPKGLLAAGAGLFAIFAMCGFCILSGIVSTHRSDRESAEAAQRREAERKQAEQDAEQYLVEAARLWEADNKSAAVTKYKAAIQRTTKAMTALPFGKSTAYQRVIEYEFAQGNTSEAKQFIEDAVNRSIPLSFDNVKLQSFAAQAQKDWREREEIARAKLSDMAKRGDGKAFARLQTGKDLTEAHRLWAEGNKAGAAMKYKAIIQGDITLVGSADRPTIYQRAIESEVDQGNTSAARGFIEDALGRDIPLSFVEPKASELLAQVQRERQERQAAALAEKKRQAQAQQKELAEKQAQEQARQKKLENAKWEGIPAEQVHFIKLVESFCKPYRDAPNELKKSVLRVERRNALKDWWDDPNRGPVKEWAGKVTAMGTVGDGRAYLTLQLDGSKVISVATVGSRRLFDDSKNLTLNIPGSSVFNNVSNLSRNDKVLFSGVFFLAPSSLDYLQEESITERGSILDPRFLFIFHDVRKQ